MYISPETHYRMINAINEHNMLRRESKDSKILPITFNTFEIFVDKLITSTRDEYLKEEVMSVFDEYLNFTDDNRIALIFQQKLFYHDTNLKPYLERREEENHQKTVENLIRDFRKLENDLRQYRIALSTDAIKNVIYLVFIKLYEEKREYEGKGDNRLRLSSFKRFQEYMGQSENKQAIHELFDLVKKDKELEETKVFTEYDRLAEKLHDDFVIDYFIKPFSKYYFYTSKIDGLGAAYEVLGQLSGKDVKVGQFFTPENVVRFMIKLAELDYDDVVLDPACGTGRFLIYSMYEMMQRVTGRSTKDKIKNIMHNQLYGTDDDASVSKLAKMNMYIHGDGKANIFDKDGLLLSNMDEKVDVILTNPPLGDLSYMKSTYDDNFRKSRMETIPKKNVTEEKIRHHQAKIKEFQEKAANNPKKKKFYHNKIEEYKKISS